MPIGIMGYDGINRHKICYTASILPTPKTDIPMRKKRLDGQQLSLLMLAFSRGLFPRPQKGNRDILVDGDTGDRSCILYFDSDFYEHLSNAIAEANRNGKFSESNSEEDWNDLKRAVDSAETVDENAAEDLREYIVI
jgi:hypothetical protein